MSKQTVLSNILGTLADTQSIENNDRALGDLVRSLGYAGIKVTVGELRAALTEQAEVCPSTFKEQPVLSLNYSPFGTEFRIRQPEAVRASRPCIEAIYKQTDRLPRNKVQTSFGLIEGVRPNAFARCCGRLRLRWAQGNFKVPSPALIRRWWTAEQRAMLVT